MSATCIGRRAAWPDRGVLDRASASGVAAIAGNGGRNRMRGPSRDDESCHGCGFRLTRWRGAERIRASMNAGKTARHSRRGWSRSRHQHRHLGGGDRGDQRGLRGRRASRTASRTWSGATVAKLRPLAIDDVSRVHLTGGSVLGTSRENPTKSAEALQAVIETLQQAGITHLVTIGGDDTALSSRDGRASARRARSSSVHVPKTIDNDLPLPPHVPTFGFQTARHVGVELVRNLMEDARSTRRWYVVVAMGRKAGHLALGIGKAAGATLTHHRRGVRRRDGAVRPHLRHRRGRDHQAPGDGPALRRRRPRRRADRQARSGGAGRPVGRRARRARPRPLRRGRPRAQGQGRGRRAGSPSAASASPSPTRTSATSCAAPIRSRSTPSTAATSATARSASWSAAAAAPWSASRAAGWCRSPSTTCASRPPARPRSAWSTPPARASAWRAPT